MNFIPQIPTNLQLRNGDLIKFQPQPVEYFERDS